jgi:hypothetical protein
MSPSVQVTLSCMLTFGVPLGFAVRELVMLRFGGWGPESIPDEPEAPLPSGEPSRPMLPDCLIPQLHPVRHVVEEHELELV